jgi:hypothetical protein
LPDWIKSNEASQVGVSIIIPDENPGVLLVTADETGAIAESAHAEIVRDHIEFCGWIPETTESFSTIKWERLLARKAGYENATKWQCEKCQSICLEEATSAPVPCEFCGSENVVAVPLETPLAPPLPPYDEEFDYSELCPDPTIAQEILDVITGLREGLSPVSLDRSRRFVHWRAYKSPQQRPRRQ